MKTQLLRSRVGATMLALAFVTLAWLAFGGVGTVARSTPQVDQGKQAQSAPDSCGSLTVAIIRGYHTPTIMVNRLKAVPGVSQVDVLDGLNSTPTLAQLQSYDLVMTAGSNHWADRAALGDVLASYVDGGGAIVQTGIDWLNNVSIAGRFETQSYSPFTTGHNGNLQSDSIGTYDASHAIMQNVTPLGAEIKTDLTLASGATQVAQYNTTHLPFIGFKGRVVGINADLTDQSMWNGNFERVIVNAANWIHNYNCPPASATPTTTGTPPTATASPTASPTPLCDIQYSDVPPGSPFYSFIECLACKGIVSGYPDGTFRPNDLLTRGQLSKIVSQSAGFHEPVMAQTYADVAPGSPFYNYIGRLSSRNVISGYPCGGVGEPCDAQNRPYFRSNTPASRGQLSKIVSNTKSYTEDPGTQLFTDVSPGSPFYDYINRLANRGVISGYPCGGAGETCDDSNRPYFRPNFNVTRGQAAKIVSNTFFPNCQDET
ncbi:MAG: hypothetical protein QOH93_1349 [Chloroflexia bacterium]|nr:hypothetical protein [Chloroflexia bacterium]